jgi:hypothetical protein
MFTRKIYIVVCLLSSLIATIDSSDVIKKELEYLEIDTDPKVQQRISILVGSASKVANYYTNHHFLQNSTF